MDDVLVDRSGFKDIVPECVGCTRVQNGKCLAYIEPALRWKTWANGEGAPCWLATHVDLNRKVVQTGKVRVGQQKSKQMRRM